MAVGSAMTSAGSTMTKGLTVPILGAGVAAVKIGGDFEEQMGRVKAISGATGDSFEDLRDQAIDLGAKTAFSAKESAAGMENLASAGFDAKEIMAAMPGLLDLAAVSGGDVALASENAATALRGFGLDAEQAGHVADVFARAAADTNAEVADMGEAMKYIAPVANAMGISLEEAAAAVGIMSDAGVKGSQAGTTLRGALARLAKPTKAMNEKMEELGISFYDGEGKMVSLQDQIGILQGAFEGLTDKQKNNALVTLYGQNSLSGMMALVEKGPGALGKLTDSLKNSDGAADEMARTMQDNMNSSIEQMLGAFESAAIVIQDILSPAIRKVADSIGGMVEKFVSAPESMQKLVLAIAAFVAAIGPVLLVVGSLITWFAKLKVAVAFLSTSLPALGPIFTLLTGPIGIIIAAITALVAILVYLYNTNETVREVIQSVWQFILTTIQTVISAVSAFVMDIWGQLTEWWKANGEEIKQAASIVWQGISDVITAVMNILSPYIKTAWELIKAIVSAVWDQIKIAVETTMNLILGIIQIITGVINGDWESVWEGIKKVTITILEAIKNTFLNVLGLIKDIVLSALNVVLKIFENILELMKNVVKTGLEKVKDFFDALGDIDLFAAGSKIIEGFLKGLEDKFNAVKDFIGGIADWIEEHKGPISYDKKLLIPAGKSIMEGLNKGLESEFESVQRTINVMADAVSEYFDMNNSISSSSLNLNGNIKTSQTLSLAENIGQRPLYVTVQSNLNGKIIASETAPYMATELQNAQGKTNFARGRRS
ncbi:phage tail tape measure protein [Enterococcus alishanensis]